MPDDEVWEGFGMAVMCLEETGDSLANRTRLVRQLLDQGMPADYSDDGKTLLHTCARKGLTSFAKELIDRGANVNARFDDLKKFARGNPMLAKQSAEWRGATPLMFAAQQGYKSCVRLLLEHGARIDIRLPDETRFPFRPGANAALMAELSGHAEVARLINEFSSDKGRATGRNAREPPQTPSRAQRLAEDEAAFDAITQDALAREIMTDAEHDVLTDRLASGHASFGAIVNKLLETGTGVELTGLSKAPQLNGRRAVVIGRRTANGRFPVRLSGREAVRVKAASLRLLQSTDRHAALAEAPLAVLDDDALAAVLAAVVHSGLPASGRWGVISRRLDVPVLLGAARATCRLFDAMLRERILGAAARIRASMFRARAKRELIRLQEGMVLQEYELCRPGWRKYDADHPVWSLEPALTHSGWAAIQGTRLSEGDTRHVEMFSKAEAEAEGYEPHVPGGELLHAPDNFKKIEKKHSDDLYSSPPFKELNPLLRSYRIAHSYSEDSLQHMGL